MYPQPTGTRSEACGGIADGAQRHQQRQEEDINPLVGLALDHPE